MVCDISATITNEHSFSYYVDKEPRRVGAAIHVGIFSIWNKLNPQILSQKLISHAETHTQLYRESFPGWLFIELGHLLLINLFKLNESVPLIDRLAILWIVIECVCMMICLNENRMFISIRLLSFLFILHWIYRHHFYYTDILTIIMSVS